MNSFCVELVMNKTVAAKYLTQFSPQMSRAFAAPLLNVEHPP